MLRRVIVKPIAGLLGAVVLLVGCETWGGEKWEKAPRAASKITVVNDADESVYFFPIERRTSQLAYIVVPPLSGPDDPRVLAPGESVVVPFDSISTFSEGDDLVLWIYTPEEGDKRDWLGRHSITWKELRQAGFRVEIARRFVQGE